MEIKARNNWKVMQLAVLLSMSVLLLIECKQPTLEETASCREISAPVHTLMALSPSWSVRTSAPALHRAYPRLRQGKILPIIGILRVGDKSYRFLGGDSLRVLPILAHSKDSCGWPAKYSYTFPGAGWERREFNDSLCWDGMGAFGSPKYRYAAHSAWGAGDIYVRRHFTIDDKDAWKGKKLFLRYVADDWLWVYCNGELIFQTKRFTSVLKNAQLDEKAVGSLRNGENVIAPHGVNTGGQAFLDIGLYRENDTYNEVDTATLKKVDVEATQTHYVFQCGEVELSLSFVSPSLTDDPEVSGAPVGFVCYSVKSKDDTTPKDVEIMFDMDVEWMHNEASLKERVNQGWRIVQSDSLYVGSIEKDMKYSYKDGHVLLSQELGKKDRSEGVLLFGYADGKNLQYRGENLLPSWNKKGDRNLQNILLSMGNRHETLQKKCNAIDSRWNKLAFEKGDSNFARNIIPAYRKFFSSHYFVESLDNKTLCFGDTLGNVREAYQSFPALAFFERIDCMKALLDPIFEYCESGYWRKRYPPYDIGLYPVANRQVKVKDYGVEVAADMLMMVAAMVEKEKDFDYADLHWETLSRWAGYLRENLPEEHSPADELLNGNDERVKCVLGLKAYYKLIELKDVY